MSFDQFQLAAPILRAVSQCGYTAPTPVQQQSIPEILAGRDLLASAQTGTGKTAAFMLPVLHRLAALKKGPKGAPRVLVMTPTRELAAQVTDATRNYGRYLRLRSSAILGGSPYGPQFRDLGRPIDLVVGTPGRLIDHLERGSLNLARLEVLILDEADRMLDMGFKEDVEKVVAAAPDTCQTLLFTATMDKTMEGLANRYLRDPVRVDIAGKKLTLDRISQRLHVADSFHHKKRLLRHFAEADEVRQAIIFSATKRGAEDLARELADMGHHAAALHGDMTQGARNRTLRSMRQGRVRLLVATDVAARGIDIPGISHVINFDMPMAAEDYVHRIGRTGRAGASGIAVSFASNDVDVQRLTRIERLIGQKLPESEIAGLEPTRPLRRPRPAGKRYGRSADGRTAGRGRYKGKGKAGRAPRREPVVEYRGGKPAGKQGR